MFLDLVFKVIIYIKERMIFYHKAFGGGSSDATISIGVGSPRSQQDGFPKPGMKSRSKLKISIDILCNNQVLSHDMSLATVRASIWKKPEDLILYYRARSD
ncbi:WD repeat-containing protein 48-like isoform X1 [Canna indica]|uniref:WD repeat-containing protein 48-like isoform X1 n=1 Tax=Canna indica TaxID=4628 RepID=A0AAQ3QFW8_9LILI|nr:WD repeat-containing protein 48-like isoform X1 [Canna indica]